MKPRNCDECKNFNYDHMPGEELCAKSHRPRFYLPKSPLDLSYGWKRKCANFEELKK